MKLKPTDYCRPYKKHLYDVWETRRDELKEWEEKNGDIETKIITSYGISRELFGFPTDYKPNRDIGFATLSDGNVVWWFL